MVTVGLTCLQPYKILFTQKPQKAVCTATQALEHIHGNFKRQFRRRNYYVLVNILDELPLILPFVSRREDKCMINRAY